MVQKGYEGQIMVMAVEHELSNPHHPDSRMPAGKPTHQPFIITKEIDRATPLLYSMLVNNETTALWELRFYMPMAGTERQHYTIKLTSAKCLHKIIYIPEGLRKHIQWGISRSYLYK